MPVEQRHTIRAGSRGVLLLFFASEAAQDGEGIRGLSHATPGATAAWMRVGEAVARHVPLSAGRLGEWSAGSLAEVHPALMPGVYQISVPDAMLAPGSPQALLVLRFPGARVAPIEVSLVAYDPQDSERMGVWSLANDKRHEFLRRAMPRLAERDLALGEAAEEALRRSLLRPTEEGQ